MSGPGLSVSALFAEREARLRHDKEAEEQLQRIHRLVPPPSRHLHHLEHRDARLSGAGEEARAQRVASELHRIEVGALDVHLHDLRGADGDSGTTCTRWPLSTRRNTGAEEISAKP